MNDTISTDKPAATRRLLLVSYWFPPAIGAAADRMAGFARHLPRQGWEVHVLTAARAESPPAMDGVTVHSVEDPLAKEQPFADFDPRVSPPKWKSIAREFVFPDRFFKWRKAAMTAGRGLAASVRFDAMLASFPPASVIQLAVGLARETGVPLVTDFRDRWIGPGGYEPSLSFVRQRHERLKMQALTRSSHAVVVSEAMAEAIAASHRVPTSKLVVIPNGYEPTRGQRDESGDATSRSRAAAGGPLVIAHVGTVISRNRPEQFLNALKDIKGDPRLKNVQFRFVGNLSKAYVQSLGLSELVDVTGLIEREAAIREMTSADALLLLTGAYVGRWGASAKLFEYVQTGLPVLCLEELPGSNDRQLLEQFIGDRAFFAPMSDSAGILARVEEIRRYRAARPNAAIELDASFREYSRENLTARLAEVLNEAAAP